MSINDFLCDKEAWCPSGIGGSFSPNGTHKILLCITRYSVLDSREYGAVSGDDE